VGDLAGLGINKCIAATQMHSVPHRQTVLCLCTFKGNICSEIWQQCHWISSDVWRP